MGLTTAERQQRYREKRRKEIAALPKIPCKCGCGTLLEPINKKGIPATFAPGHFWRGRQRPKGRTPWNKGKPGPPSPRKGMKAIELGWTPETFRQRTETRRAKNGGLYTSPESQADGIAKRPDSWYHNVIAALKTRDVIGPRNPAWRGGVSVLPYGPEFTKRFKRLIRERDHFQCQFCKRTEAQELKEARRVLSIHHIDHDKANNAPSNLVTVCNRCNIYFSHHREDSLYAFPIRRMLLS